MTNYRVKILDPLGGDQFWGAAANYLDGSGYCPAHIQAAYGYNKWESWHSIEKTGSKFNLGNRQVKVLHFAGGGSSKPGLEVFNDKTRRKIQDILDK